jgi:hypothetical protein
VLIISVPQYLARITQTIAKAHAGRKLCWVGQAGLPPCRNRSFRHAGARIPQMRQDAGCQILDAANSLKGKNRVRHLFAAQTTENVV